jgi:hypothetical protein
VAVIFCLIPWNDMLIGGNDDDIYSLRVVERPSSRVCIKDADFH